MTPEVTQETGRRRTTSEGQYQSSHENTPMVDSPDFAHNLALNPGGRPREVSTQFQRCKNRFIKLTNTLFVCQSTHKIIKLNYRYRQESMKG